MGIIRLSSKIQKVLTNDRMVTRNIRYSTIGSDLIIARCSQVANVKPATVRSGILGLKEAVCYFVVNGHHVNLGKLCILRLDFIEPASARLCQSKLITALAAPSVFLFCWS